MILLHDLKGATCLDRSKDMSVHVSTCTNYSINVLTPVVALIRRVCFYVSSQKWVIVFLEKQINIRFCVKLGKNANDTCIVFSEAYGGEAVEKFTCFWVA
jgi:hypothetical protein